MPVSKPVLLHEVRQLVDRGAQLVEVLPRSEYERLHIAGAVSIPLRELAERAGELDRSRPVVVYCYDALCDLSPRAARRLDSLGFPEVYDYVPSKVDWCANGLPCEGAEAGLPRIADLADRDVPTCRLDETAGDVRARVGEWDVAVVVDGDDVVLGIVRAEALTADAGRRIGDVMRDGPSTYRPDVPVTEMAARLRDHPEPRVLVTHADGTLVGVAQPEDVERAAKTTP